MLDHWQWQGDLKVRTVLAFWELLLWPFFCPQPLHLLLPAQRPLRSGCLLHPPASHGHGLCLYPLVFVVCFQPLFVSSSPHWPAGLSTSFPLCLFPLQQIGLLLRVVTGTSWNPKQRMPLIRLVGMRGIMNMNNTESRFWGTGLTVQSQESSQGSWQCDIVHKGNINNKHVTLAAPWLSTQKKHQDAQSKIQQACLQFFSTALLLLSYFCFHLQSVWPGLWKQNPAQMLTWL